MLRLSKLTDAEYVLGQVAGGLEDYYLGAGEAPGVWSGRLAGELGLVGVVGAAELRALIERRHPGSGEALGGGRTARVRAVDATFSAPKSVSLLWAFGDPETAAVVSVAHVEAVEAALGFVERRAAVTRRQRGGVRARASTSGWAAATFVHRTSRSGDPQLHTHAVIPNVVRRDDGVWVALDATELYRWAKAAGSVYQEQLRRLLVERLGVAWGPDRNGCRELNGIGDAQLRAFSKRTGQIEAYLAARGESDLADRRARMRADEAASVATRPAKDRTLTPQRLRDRWDAEAAAVGLPCGAGLLDAVGAGGAPRAGLDRRAVQELFDRLVDPELGLCRHDARFGEAQVIEAVAAWGAGRLNTGEIETLAGWFLDSPRVVRLHRPDPTGRSPGQWSTLAHRRVEDRLLANLARLTDRHSTGIAGDPDPLEASGRFRLGQDQEAAVAALCGPGAALRALISPAGYGKTTTLSAAVDAARRAGREVVAVSTTNQAVDQLAKVGIPATTVARFVADGSRLAAGTVLVVDEFSQLPTREADALLAAAAGCRDGMVWMVGDPLQAQPVGPGGLAAWLAEQTAGGAVPVAELTVNRRQADPTERHALAAYRDGRVGDSQQVRDGAGWEHHHPDRDAAVAAMAAAVAADLRAHGPSQVAALAVTHADCETLADDIRARLAADGRLTGPTLEGPGWSGPRHYQAGDRILLHAHLPAGDQRRLANGTTATILAVTADGLRVRADDAGPDQTVLVPAGFVAGRRADGRSQVSHAWARTIDGVQGGTYRQVHLLATPALDHYRGYVGQSRGIQPTHTWNTTLAPAGEAGDHGGRVLQAATSTAEQIAAALARAHPKTFAAADDPYRHEATVRAEQAHHHDVLARRPPEVTEQIQQARRQVAACVSAAADAHQALAYWQQQAGTGKWAVKPGRRRAQRDATRAVADLGVEADQAQGRLTAACTHLGQLIDQQAAADGFEHDNAWRHEHLEVLDQRLARHWTDAVVAAAREGHPHVYGPGRLATARRFLCHQLGTAAPSRTPAPGPGAEVVSDPARALADLDTAVATARTGTRTGTRPAPTRRRSPGAWPTPGLAPAPPLPPVPDSDPTITL